MQLNRSIVLIKIVVLALVLALVIENFGFSSETSESALERTAGPIVVETDQTDFPAELSAEFGIDPEVAQIVYELAGQLVDPRQAEWRLVQTPEFLSHLMMSIIYAESRGNWAAVGDDGRAYGLTQIWLSTARVYGEVTAEELLIPRINLEYSFRHFHHLLKRYRGNLSLALYAWNRGETKVDQLLRFGQSPSNGYASRVYRASLESRKSQSTGDD